MAAILGFIPALERRFSIDSKSGSAAKVVPNPAKNPIISDLWNLGTSRLDVSWGTRSSQPQHMAAAKTRKIRAAFDAMSQLSSSPQMLVRWRVSIFFTALQPGLCAEFEPQ